MKKSFLFAAMAAVVLSGCYKNEVVEVNNGPKEISFKAVSNVATKVGAELDGTLLTKEYGIYASATQKNVDGTIENGTYFEDQLFQTADSQPVDVSKYHAWDTTANAAAPIYWPIGGGEVDFLAYALPTAMHEKISIDWVDDTDIASKVVLGWNTYDQQIDLLYAANNGATVANNANTETVGLVLEHAQALLEFQVKVNIADVFTLRQIELVGLQAGTELTIDNTRNNLVAEWTGIETDAQKDTIVANVADEANDRLYEPLVNTTKFEQVGTSLLIPQQPRLNFLIHYTLSGNDMTYEFNELRGAWENGKKYIYNLDIYLNEIIITEEVLDWDEVVVEDKDNTDGDIDLQ